MFIIILTGLALIVLFVILWTLIGTIRSTSPFARYKPAFYALLILVAVAVLLALLSGIHWPR